MRVCVLVCVKLYSATREYEQNQPLKYEVRILLAVRWNSYTWQDADF